MAGATFHAGELALQRRYGSAETLAEVGPRIIRDRMPAQHRMFFGQLPFVVLGALDADGQTWAGALAGRPGFMRSPHERQLDIAALPPLADPLHAALVPGAPVGLLGLEPHTRRRNRLNGTLMSVGAGGFSMQVGQSFGNCPKYIQARRPAYVAGSSGEPVMHTSKGLDEAALRTIANADTFFIATAHPQAATAAAPERGVDVSHRGGKPGFVRVQGQTLTVPDYLGNFFFNTLGNLALNPRCGLLFIDFDSGGLLQLAAHAELVLEGAELESFAGAQRLLRLHVLACRRMDAALPLRWGPAELSPSLADTGAWQQQP